MIYSETIEIIHSHAINIGVNSEVDEDYRVLEESLRITEDNEARITEEKDLRSLEK